MFFWGFAHGDMNVWCFPCEPPLGKLFCGLPYLEQSSREDRRVLSDMCRMLAKEADRMKREFDREDAAERTLFWQDCVLRLQDFVVQYKEKVKEVCLLVLRDIWDASASGLFPGCEWSTATFIDLMLDNICALDSKAGINAPLKQQFSFIERKLKVFGKFASITKLMLPGAAMAVAECISQTQTWAYHMSCLVCLYWINDGIDESTTGTMLSGLMQKYMPRTPRVIAMYLDVLKASGCTYQGFQSEANPQLVVSYVDFLLENLVISEFDKLHEGLIFLLSLCVDLVHENSEQLMLHEIYATITQVPDAICFPETNLSNFLDKIDGIKVQARGLYVVSPLVSQFNSPKNGAMGFLNSFLANMKQMLEGNVNFTPCVKHQIGIVHEELLAIKPLLQTGSELLKQHEKLNDLWTRVVDVVYNAAYVVKLCPVASACAWYGIICLPNVIEDIKAVKSEIEAMRVVSSSKGAIDYLMESSNALLTQATTSKDEEAFTGFKKDVEDIRNHLVRGRKNRTIVSVSGMAGQGKTTLAKRLYNDPSVSYYFHVKVWSYVSQDCNLKALLFNIACQVGCNVVNANSDIGDLMGSVRQSLKGRRYLIVLDDIWDVDVWRSVGCSFPDDSNGSRILFTCRLASLADSGSISHHLRAFSDEESWELMKKKLGVHELEDIAKRMAVRCHGLPLAIALIGSLLKSTARVLWEEVAENLNSYLDREGCLDIIELSFRYLPEHLKPCFLYVGAFPRGESIRPKDLKHFWITEGFVEKDLASKYLDDLVAHSLVVVTERNSTGGIKECNVHDLLYSLCLEKAAQDNFIHLAGAKIVYGTEKRHGFLHRLRISKNDLVALPQSSSTMKELPTGQIHSLSFDSDFHEHASLFKFLSRFKVLTKLDLKHVFLSVFPEVILCNIQLRYLSLRGASNIPASIVHLWSLETLIVVDGYGFDRLTSALWEIDSLKHVEISHFRLSVWPHESPISMAAVSNLEVLGGILLLRNDVRTREFMRRLSKLKKLKCGCNHPNTLLSMVGSLKKLESLKMNLSSRYYPFYQQEVPVFEFLSNLKKLSLKELRLPWDSTVSIGLLPNLEVLKLHTSAFEGSIWFLLDGHFSKLRYLKLDNMDVERIDSSNCDYPFPCLEKLLLTYCRNLQKIPLTFASIDTLDTIDITGSLKASSSVRRVVAQKQDYGNDHLRVFGLIDMNRTARALFAWLSGYDPCATDEEDSEGDDEE